ncbi:hypothetical protein KU306_06050 [Haloferax larsenii]|uniref:Uncharacterized protein n=1 Tax=Haloferax larsenii TaxID=302484 RepID=A0ABY5RK95_HALLR|nr:hypothetical protein [Haloferax larsenii]UVE51438.1 hypothetical protein KU306_06050 [Haloferax larsenii]
MVIEESATFADRFVFEGRGHRRTLKTEPVYDRRVRITGIFLLQVVPEVDDFPTVFTHHDNCPESITCPLMDVLDKLLNGGPNHIINTILSFENILA